MGAANKSQINLGTSSMEVTREPIGSNSPELLPKIQICGVYPTKINGAPSPSSPDYQNWTYRFPTCVIVTVEMTDGFNFIFDLQEITNQPTWTGDLAGQQQCVTDINTWLGT